MSSFRRVDAASAVVLFLHGHGRIMLNDNTVFSHLFQQNGLAVVCPDGGRSWWLDVICEDFHPEMTTQNWLLDSVVPFIEEKFGVQPPRIPLLGISMGGQGALQLAFRQASNFPIVAAISPAVDFFQLYGSGIPLANVSGCRSCSTGHSRFESASAGVATASVLLL